MLWRFIGERKGFDWLTFAIYLALVITGVLSLYSVLYSKDKDSNMFSFDNELGRYMIFVALSLFLFFIVYLIEWKFWYTFAYPLYFLSIIMLVGVLLFGAEIKGSRSWFIIGGFSFQPSEFAKFGTALALSSYLAHYKNSLRNINNVLQAFMLILIPVILILLQPDAGSAMVFLSLLIVMYRAGFTPVFYVILGLLGATFITTLIYNPHIVSLVTLAISFVLLALFFLRDKIWYLVTALTVGGGIYLFLSGYKNTALSLYLLFLLVFAFLYWLKNRENPVILIPFTAVSIIIISFATNYAFYHILKPHQQDRINVWLNPEKCDPRGSLYNVLQSKTAIGAGGFAGKGFLKGNMTHLNFVPEQATDFIFSAIGEEQGFIGVASIIILYLLLLIRIITIAERGKTLFITYYGYAVAGYIFFHFFMNIGMNMGLVPVVGIPLPFISKGGSSLIVFSIMLAVLLKMDADRKLR